MIKLDGISKTYATNTGPNRVLKHITAKFPSNQNIGILGLNGAGKSTLLRIMAGVELPDEGNVVRKGKVSWPIGFKGGFNGSLTGEENCRFVARIYGEEVDRVVGFTQDFSEIGNYFYMPVRTYSSGMKARLAFGLSMAIDFNVYLVDETTAVGDKPFRRKCRRAFRERRERSSVIMVSHSMSTIEDYCEKCAVLSRGALRMFDSVQEAAEVYKRVKRV
jgi:capsular polysaccharide transport system ATP-binding protein